MKEEIKTLAKDLKKFLASAEEEDLIMKAAPAGKAEKGAAFKVSKPQESRPQETAPMQNATPLQEPPSGAKAEILETLAGQIKTCARCNLGSTRIKAVPGEGNVNAKLMFVGEGPGYEEDRQGRPFVGKAGQLLDKIIAAMGFTREEVFIANMVKCHPMVDPSDPDKRGNDRAPNSDEIATCRRYVEQQINAISPDYIVALGGVAAKSLIMEAKSLSAIRGKIYNLELSTLQLNKPVKILATFHPAALLRNPGWKKDAWADLKTLLADMGRTPPAQNVPLKKDI
jgi:DNA polymerase